MTNPEIDWSVPRFGVSMPMTRAGLISDYSIVALLLLSGLLTGNGARILLGLTLATLNLVATDAFGIRGAIPNLNGEKRPLTRSEWLAIAVGAAVLVGAVLYDFTGFLFLIAASAVAWVLIHDAGRIRRNLPLLGSPVKSLVAIGWIGLWVAGLILLGAISPGRGVSDEPAAPSAARQADGRFEASVLRAVDGDTLEVRSSGRQFHVRVLGADTTELRRADCFAREGAARSQALTAGQTVLLQYDTNQKGPDRNGRDRAHVWLTGNTSLGFLLIREGYARVPDYRAPHYYEADYHKAQDLARAEGRGGWRTCGW
jgi:endonuclease YncB( thermonuclease family)